MKPLDHVLMFTMASTLSDQEVHVFLDECDIDAFKQAGMGEQAEDLTAILPATGNFVHRVSMLHTRVTHNMPIGYPELEADMAVVRTMLEPGLEPHPMDGDLRTMVAKIDAGYTGEPATVETLQKLVDEHSLCLRPEEYAMLPPSPALDRLRTGAVVASIEGTVKKAAVRMKYRLPFPSAKAAAELVRKAVTEHPGNMKPQTRTGMLDFIAALEAYEG